MAPLQRLGPDVTRAARSIPATSTRPRALKAVVGALCAQLPDNRSQLIKNACSTIARSWRCWATTRRWTARCASRSFPAVLRSRQRQQGARRRSPRLCLISARDALPLRGPAPAAGDDAQGVAATMVLATSAARATTPSRLAAPHPRAGGRGLRKVRSPPPPLDAANDVRGRSRARRSCSTRSPSPSAPPPPFEPLPRRRELARERSRPTRRRRRCATSSTRRARRRPPESGGRRRGRGPTRRARRARRATARRIRCASTAGTPLSEALLRPPPHVAPAGPPAAATSRAGGRCSTR